ncbi:MAG: caspase family protein [Bacteroidetes bacterium]|nr:MAG: caspase family protein [Bacteroidota bacterium]TAG92757.1 MAG: caspase family protein [Bacteroidota bacterium]
MKKIFALFFLLSLLSWSSFAQSELEKPKENRASKTSTLHSFDVSYLLGSGEAEDLDLVVSEGGKNYLLIIAIDKYKHWKSLANAVKDARDLKAVLKEKYGFIDENIFEYLNEEASPENVRDAFESLKAKATPQDNLLIYYSGHGSYDPSFDLGYWIPSNGRLGGNATSTYIPNDHIRNYIKGLDAFRHIFLVADACFSGSLFASEAGKRGGAEEEAKESLKSRWGLSSGNLEEVSDGEKGKNSPFATALINYLKSNLKDRLRASEVIEYVKGQVTANTQQTPIGSNLTGVGHEGGNFIFMLTGEAEAVDKKKK